jgi:membrane protein YdbS with pleckstrin-like domain
MLETLRAKLMRFLRVPDKPVPPAGAREIQIFRAAPNYYQYRVVLWGAKQVSAVAAFLFYLRFVPHRGWAFAGPTVASLLTAIEALALTAFVLQIPITFAIVKLDFELRWYLLSDRSLRIREGILSLREKTMTYANVQQISIRQNPLQRLLGIADVKVRSAGGGAGETSGGRDVGESMHETWFRGVDRPEEIRSAIQDRVRAYADAGLGDPEDARSEARSGFAAANLAARELHDEIRRLRATLSPSFPPDPPTLIQEGAGNKISRPE